MSSSQQLNKRHNIDDIGLVCK